MHEPTLCPLHACALTTAPALAPTPLTQADRVEDVTPPALIQADPKVARTIAAFGYGTRPPHHRMPRTIGLVCDGVPIGCARLGARPSPAAYGLIVCAAVLRGLGTRRAAVRGTFLKQNMRAHVPGLGDFTLEDVSALDDPCPFPQVERRRRLNAKEKLLHAPMANLGEVTQRQPRARPAPPRSTPARPGAA